ncbi:DUF4105 domain-containing protein [Corallococcus macrosporus]|uniref:Lnb N-terminal periplasmic domain-containing protein n=1 Tax=Corallococcus macrosporus DSM 14697 TaxID=1189310 RepID=A0A250JZF2_9BACT|nr:DUF4105 domain-containing protein [Corallococcus macrosporus]ATB48486.1 hypothetical protein MYMAC_004113 [Corallococcus macrosporus DSM 14697]
MARHAVLILVVALFPAAALAAPPPEGYGGHPEALRVRLVTIGPGADLHQRFGHSALWVEDTRLGTGFLYSYGTTSIGNGGPVPFLLGRPTFWAARLSVERTFLLYRALARSIGVQELALTVAQRQRLLARLEHDVLPASREYAYHPLRDNCATRVRDVLDEALGGALRQALTAPARGTQRALLQPYVHSHPVAEWLLMLWLNDDVDAPATQWEEAFLPRELARLLEGVSVVDGFGGRTLLVAREGASPPSPSVSVPPGAGGAGGVTWGPGAGGAVLAVLLAFLRGRGTRPAFRILFGLYHAVFGLTLGAAGMALCGLMVFSRLDVMQRNENLLLANPLAFGLLPLGVLMMFGGERAERWARRCVWLLVAGSVLAVALKLLPAFDQDNRGPMALFLVANLGLGLAHAWRLRRPSVPPFAVGPAPGLKGGARGPMRWWAE